MTIFSSPHLPAFRVQVPQRRRRGAFTLVELLVAMTVLLVMVLMMVSIANSTNNIWRTSRTRIEAFQSARIALRTDHDQSQSGQAQYLPGLLQLDDGYLAEPLGHFARQRSERQSEWQFVCGSIGQHELIAHHLPGWTVFGYDQLPAYGGQTCYYVGFNFLPNGSTDLDPTATAGWFVTLLNANQPLPTKTPPQNFVYGPRGAHSGPYRVFPAVRANNGCSRPSSNSRSKRVHPQRDPKQEPEPKWAFCVSRSFMVAFHTEIYTAACYVEHSA